MSLDNHGERLEVYGALMFNPHRYLTSGSILLEYLRVGKVASYLATNFSPHHSSLFSSSLPVSPSLKRTHH